MADDDPVSFSELRDHLMPPGSDKQALWDALKQAHRTGGFTPGRAAPDISLGAPPVPGTARKALTPPHPAMPEDPFTGTDPATIAVADTWHGLVRQNVPPDHADRIVGTWLGTIPGDIGGLAAEREALLLDIAELWGNEPAEWPLRRFDGRTGCRWILTALRGDPEALHVLGGELARLKNSR